MTSILIKFSTVRLYTPIWNVDYDLNFQLIITTWVKPGAKYTSKLMQNIPSLCHDSLIKGIAIQRACPESTLFLSFDLSKYSCSSSVPKKLYCYFSALGYNQIVFFAIEYHSSVLQTRFLNKLIESTYIYGFSCGTSFLCEILGFNVWSWHFIVPKVTLNLNQTCVVQIL